MGRQAKALRAVISVRVSNDKSGELRSPEESKEDGLRECARHGWEPVAIINEGSISGTKSRAEREGHDRLRKMIANKDFDVLVAFSSSRTNRNVKEGMETLAELEGSGIMYHYNGRLFDPSDPHDMIRMQHDVVDDAGYVLQVKRYVKKALDANADKGKHHGRVPFGYKVGAKRGSLVRDPDTDWIIAEAAKRLLSGESAMSVVAWLDTVHPLPQRYAAKPGSKWVLAHGPDVPMPWGKPGWDQSRLKYMMTNPAYVGIRRHIPIANRRNGGKPRVETEATWAADAILTYEQHRALVAMYDEPWRKQHRNNPERRFHLLSGLLICSVCGDKLYALTSTSGRQTYRCKHGHVTVGALDVERFVAAFITEGLTKGYGAIRSAPSAGEATINDKVARLQHQHDDTVATLEADEDEDGEPLSTATVQRLEKRLAKLAAEIAELEAQRPKRRPRSATTEDMRAAESPAAHWNDLATADPPRNEELAAVIRDLVTITVHPLAKGAARAWSAERVTIEWVDEADKAAA